MSVMSIENGDSKTYWDGARAGKLLMQHCEACNHTQFPPRHMCAKCWGPVTWRECSGKGVVESFSIVTRAPTADMRNKVPYAVVAVLIEEGPRMMTNIVGPDALNVQIDDMVTVTFEPDMHGRVLPQFKRVV